MTANVNVTTNVGGPTIIVTHRNTGPGFFIRALWFIFIGSWVSGIAIIIAYAAVLTIIGLPLAFMIFNRLPTILTLRPRTADFRIRTQEGVTHLDYDHIEQRPWWQRAIYFLGIGWWFGAVWLSAAYLLGLLIIPLPLTFWMFNRTSGVMTLQRH
jgi:uncharacterized membrane protein YccF (DUF307 family)